MTALSINLDVDANPWTDLQDGRPPLTVPLERIGLLDAGMTSGRASVALVLRLPDGTPVIAEASFHQLVRLALPALSACPIGQRQPL